VEYCARHCGACSHLTLLVILWSSFLVCISFSRLCRFFRTDHSNSKTRSKKSCNWSTPCRDHSNRKTPVKNTCTDHTSAMIHFHLIKLCYITRLKTLNPKPLSFCAYRLDCSTTVCQKGMGRYAKKLDDAVLKRSLLPFLSLVS
jgi:hypothetical protein